MGMGVTMVRRVRRAERIVAEAAIRPGETVVDVGAGTGALTARLIDAGARVVAVELHPKRLAALRRRFGSTVTVVRADAADRQNSDLRVVVVAMATTTTPHSAVVRR